MSSPSSNPNSHGFLLVLVLAVLAALTWMLLPYFGALLSAVVVGVAMYPMHERVARKFSKQSASVHAALSLILVIMLIIAPAMFVIWTTVNEAKELGPLVARLQIALENLRGGNTDSFAFLSKLRHWLTDTLGIQSDVFRRQLISM